MVRKNLYAIKDMVADDIIGGIHLHGHHAPAVRMFTDVLDAAGTAINKHPEDFELLCLGSIDTDGVLTSTLQTIVTGSAIVASRNKE